MSLYLNLTQWERVFPLASWCSNPRCNWASAESKVPNCKKGPYRPKRAYFSQYCSDFLCYTDRKSEQCSHCKGWRGQVEESPTFASLQTQTVIEFWGGSPGYKTALHCAKSRSQVRTARGIAEMSERTDVRRSTNLSHFSHSRHFRQLTFVKFYPRKVQKYRYL